jgi:RNA polymerase sigma-70 factor (ECF subfamily)
VVDRRRAHIDSPAQDELSRCLEENTQPLLDSIRVYVFQYRLARGDEARAQAAEILQEVAVEAIAHADRFTMGRRPLPWLLGIALNIIRRRRAEDARRAAREVPASDLALERDEYIRDSAPLDQAADTLAATQLERVEDDAEAEALLALVPEADRQVLRLAVVEGWDSEGLAQQLGTSSVAARVRLHRAIGRLRAAWFARQNSEHGEHKGGLSG